MSSDILERLRSQDRPVYWGQNMKEAADEIERLRTEFSAVLGDAIAKDAEITRLQALLDEVIDGYADLSKSYAVTLETFNKDYWAEMTRTETDVLLQTWRAALPEGGPS